MGELILLRHGETEWSRDGRHTGRTDVPLTPAGEAAAAALAAAARGPAGARRVHQPGAARRADRGAGRAGRAKPDPDLQEWDYGGYEGRTTAEIQAERPGWYLWRDGVIPGGAAHPGETVAEVGARADAVLARVSAAARRRRRRAGRPRPPAARAHRPLAAAGARGPAACSGSTRRP